MSTKKGRKPAGPRGPAPGVQQITATPPAVEAGGRVWRFGFCTQNAKGALEELVRAHVVRGAVGTKRALGGSEGEDYFAGVQSRIDRGHYRTFAPGWLEVLASPDGIPLFVRSLLLAHQPDATAADVAALMAAEPEQVAAAVGAVAPDFFLAVAVQMGASPADAAAARGKMAAAVLDRMTPAPGTGSP